MNRLKVATYVIFIAIACGMVYLIGLGLDLFIQSLDTMLNPCQHGTPFVNGECLCFNTPFKGPYCGESNCSNGYIVKGQGTTPRMHSDYGCKCTEKYFGFLCDQCNSDIQYEVSDGSILPKKVCKGNCNASCLDLSSRLS